ncbi:MAG: hypothetical protein PHQ11_11185 [Paludibacter sp.]|nr:hypothetical protein [Paludibacter sp.]
MYQNSKLIMCYVRIACLAFFAVVFFVSAASAVTVVDQDLIFGDASSLGSTWVPFVPYPDSQMYEYEGNLSITYSFNDTYDWSAYDGGTWSFNGFSGEIVVSQNAPCLVGFEGVNSVFITGFRFSNIDLDYETTHNASLAGSGFDCGLDTCVVGSPSFTIVITPGVGVKHHVTVDYDEEEDSYTITLLRYGVGSSAFIEGKIFGWLPVITHAHPSLPGQSSTDDWVDSVPGCLIGFGYDYTLTDICNGVSVSVSWSLADVPNAPDPPPVISTVSPSYTPTPLPTSSDGSFLFNFSTVDPDDYKLPVLNMDEDYWDNVTGDWRDSLSVNNTSIWYNLQQGSFDTLDDTVGGFFEFLEGISSLIFMPVTAFTDWCLDVYYFLTGAYLNFEPYLSFPRYVMGQFVKVIPVIIMNICLTALLFVASLRLFRSIVPVLGGVTGIGLNAGNKMAGHARSGARQVKRDYQYEMKKDAVKKRSKK